MYSSDGIACNNQYQMMNTSSSNLLDLNDSSNSQGNGDAMYRSSSMKKKPIRDPFAHRRVEKTRRDRMNFSLNRLCSLIPESFRNQVNQGNTRVDKIKIVDIAILYVEHLHEMLGQYTSKDSESTKNKKTDKQSETKKDAQTSTCDIVPLNSSSNTDLDLSYIKGFFNGTLEYLSYLIEFNVLNKINKPNQSVATNTKTSSSTNTTDEISVIYNIEFFINILRKFHAIYFNKIKLSPEKIKSVIDSNIKSNESNDAKRSLSFPFNNKKLIKKILYILSSYAEPGKPQNFFKYYKKIYEYVLDYNICNDKFNFPTANDHSMVSSSSSKSSSPNASSCSSRSSSASSASRDSDESNSSDTEVKHKKSKNSSSNTMTSSHAKRNDTQLSIHTLDSKPQCSQKQTAKKLKSNLIERFSSTNQADVDVQEIIPVPIVQDDNIKTRIIETSDATNNEATNDEMLSIFILHSSHDFYLSGCLDKSLLDEQLLKQVIKNPEFQPKNVQKIKLDVVFGADIVIKSNRNNNLQTTSTYSPLFSNKRKIKEQNPKLHSSLMNRFNYNLSDENRILESYLKAIRKAHENKKRHTNGTKYDNLTILYKNYSRSANFESFGKSSTNDDDQQSERTFYTI